MNSFHVTELAGPMQLPQVQAPSLEGLSVTIPAQAGFSAEEVQQRFLEVARPHATERYRYPSEGTEWMDEVLLSIAGYVHGKLIPFSVRKEVWLPLEPEPLLPGLYETLVGRKPNETVVVDLVLPETYLMESLRGVQARFVVHIHAARQVKYPELESPAFLQALGRGATLQEAMRSILQQMEQERVQDLAYQARQRVLDEVAARTEVKIPTGLIDQEIQLRWNASEGVTVRELELSVQDQTESLNNWLKDPLTRSRVEQQLRLGLALGAICKRDGLQLTPEYVEGMLKEQAAAAGVSLEALAQSLRAEPENLARIDQTAWHLMAVEHVMSRAQIHFVPA
ncbi:hypothetical protein [Hyalangium minutum]|uniref:Trigger factor C-terminal domain-containing protein n=1 Tax=Hyalangium minutum TaxID=394096 RepID=A0A085WA51_9BACT|nr:hypothetical protein [Hyalangium minutum]KFE64564.1 hypothetical protein DB31_1582 [Hyalangium minutum]